MRLKRVAGTFVLGLLAFSAVGQQAAIKTNVLYLATTSPNLGFEFRLADRWTMELHGGGNCWDFPDQATLGHVLGRIEPKYWFCEPFNGSSLGLDLFYGRYRIGNIPFLSSLEHHRYEGTACGAGIAYGYHLVVGGRWGIEFSVAAGYARVPYDKYESYECKRLSRSSVYHHWGVTRVGVAFLFFFG